MHYSGGAKGSKWTPHAIFGCPIFSCSRVPPDPKSRGQPSEMSVPHVLNYILKLMLMLFSRILPEFVFSHLFRLKQN